MTDERSSANKLPQQLGPYQVTRRIGRGAMGDIYLAVDTRDGKHVAVKTPSVESQDRERLLRRFRREARAAEAIRHPHVCRVYETNADAEPVYYAMEWIDGVTLRQWMTEHPRVPVPHAVELAIKLAAGLQAAHDVGILHRDLKSENVMMRSDHDPVIVDFGLARWFDGVGQSLLTVEGSILGSPAYMAPEQIMADGQEVGPAADVYSLAVVLYELLTGRLPFEGDGIAVLFRAVNETPPPAQQQRPEVDATLDAILHKAMAKDPQQRFASAAEFAAALECQSRGEAWLPTEREATREPACPEPDTPPSSARGIRRLFPKFWR